MPLPAVGPLEVVEVSFQVAQSNANETRFLA